MSDNSHHFKPFQVYGDAHRMFVQSMMKRKLINANELTKLFKIACVRNNLKIHEKLASNQKKVFLKAVNIQLKNAAGLVLKNVSDEIKLSEKSGEIRYLVLVNTRSDNKTFRSMVNYANHELEYLKILVQGIMANRSKHIRSMDTVNIVKLVTSKKITGIQGEEILSKFVKNKWLLQERFGGDLGPVFIRLHPRFIAEMEHWLKEVYPDDIEKCEDCDKIVVKAIRCSKCKSFFHKACIFAKKTRAPPFKRGHCVKCQTEINLKMIELEETQSRTTISGTKKSPIKRKAQWNEEETTETESEPDNESTESE